MKENPWARLLAYVTGLINQELLLKNEYLGAKNRILQGTVSRRHRNGAKTRRGRNSFNRIWPCLAGIGFFTVEVVTWRGLVTYYISFFIHQESRRVSLAGITRHPDYAWIQQMARNATGEAWGFLDQRRCALHDRDTKFCPLFRATLAAGGIKPIQLPARSPNLNSHAERWVRSVKSGADRT